MGTGSWSAGNSCYRLTWNRGRERVFVLLFRGLACYAEKRRNRAFWCKADCTTKPVRKELLENIIISSLVSNIFHPDNTEILTEKINKQIEEKCSQVVEEEKVINSQLNKTKRKIKNLLTAIEDGASEFRLIKDRLKELQEEKEKLQLQLEQLQQQLNRSKVSVSTVREYLAHGLTNLQANNPKAFSTF